MAYGYTAPQIPGLMASAQGQQQAAQAGQVQLQILQQAVARAEQAKAQDESTQQRIALEQTRHTNAMELQDTRIAAQNQRASAANTLKAQLAAMKARENAEKAAKAKTDAATKAQKARDELAEKERQGRIKRAGAAAGAEAKAANLRNKDVLMRQRSIIDGEATRASSEYYKALGQRTRDWEEANSLLADFDALEKNDAGGYVDVYAYNSLMKKYDKAQAKLAATDARLADLKDKAFIATNARTVHDEKIAAAAEAADFKKRAAIAAAEEKAGRTIGSDMPDPGDVGGGGMGGKPAPKDDGSSFDDVFGGGKPDLAGIAAAIRKEHPEWTKEQVLAELRKRAK